MRMQLKLSLFIIFLSWPRYIANSGDNPSPNMRKSCCGVNKDTVSVEGQGDIKKGGSKEESCTKGSGVLEVPSDSKYSPEKNQLLDNKFLLVKGGRFFIGTDKPVFPQDGEGPVRKVYLDDFYMNEFEVSNEEFTIFVQETQYITEVTILCNSDTFFLLSRKKLNFESLYLLLRMFSVMDYYFCPNFV